MKTFLSLALVFSGLAASVSAHGYIVSPPRRAPGAKMSAACGQTIYNTQAADNAGPIEILLQSASSIVDAGACNLWLCKGYQFVDNTAQVQTYSLGQTVDMEVKIIAPHTGYANVSIVDTKTDTVKGSFLKSWAVYASTSTGVTANETNFSITIPTDLTGCTTAGECVIQWFWYAPPGVNQTYESCVDFVIGDGTAASTSAAASTSTAVTSTATVAPTTSPIAQLSTSSTVEAPTTSSVVKSPTASTIAGVSTPTSSIPTTTTVDYTTVAPTKSTSAAAETTSAEVTPTIAPAVTTPTTIPTTFATRTRTCADSSSTTISATLSSTCYVTSVDYNKCLDAANACMRNAQSKPSGVVDFSACNAQWAACKMC